jgi:hypothetical protein
MEAVKPMKRFLLGVTFLGAAAVLGGCPIYPSNNNSYAEYQVCTGSGCFSCPDPYYSGACVPWACGSNNDCPSGYACTTQSSDINAPASCLPATTGPSGGCSSPAGCPSGQTCGDDGQCHSADCGTVGCPNGYQCVLSGGQAQCESPAPPTYDAGDDSTTPTEAGQPEAGTDSTSGGDDSSTGGDSSTTTPDAGADAPPEAAAPTPCTSDPDCASVGSGARCIDGMCRAQVDLCSDTTQCNVAGEACVDGICEPRCSASDPCPTGYSCDLTRAVCNINLDQCTDSSACKGGTTCVEAHCVPPCGTSDAGANVCPAGQVCVNGGCLPDQAPSAFACTNDGQDGPTANACGAGQVCLHHDCYNECGSDSGLPSCASSEQCTSVTIETGTYAVCATPTTMGSDCDPAQGKACSGGRVCVDGHCL